MSKRIEMNKMVSSLDMEVIVGSERENSYIYCEDINRPGLELTGYMQDFSLDRIQLIGKQEMSYLQSLEKELRYERLSRFISCRPTCIIITRGQTQIEILRELCCEYKVPLLRTQEKTTTFISKITNLLDKELADEKGIHAVCMNVFGVGVLIRGQSGIGKSEVALSLIERGHRLISDDLVLLRKIGPYALIGTHNGANYGFLALRGPGLVNVMRLYGSGSYQRETKINLDIELNPWNENEYYDAMGMERKEIDYMGITVRSIEIPVRPGRDLASLIEVSAKNWRLEQEGYHALDDFHQKLKRGD